MLRRLSTSGLFIQLIAFLALASLLWTEGLAHAMVPVRTVSEGPLYTLLAGWLSTSPTLSVILALVLTLSLCLILNLITYSADLISRENILPATMLIVLLSWNSKLLLLHPILPAAVLILIAVYTLMNMYGQQDPYRQVFTASFNIGLASLFYFPSVYLLLMVLMSFVTFRITSYREWVIAFTGFLLPVIYLLSWYYLSNSFEKGLAQIIHSIEDPGLRLQHLTGIDYAWLIFMLLVLLAAGFGVVNRTQDKLISIRKKTFVMVNFTLSVLVLILISGAPVEESHQLFFFPLAFFMAANIGLVKKSIIQDMFYMAFILFLLALRIIL